MNNPFARYLDKAEVSLGDLGRRAIESVTLPIRIKSQEVIAEVTGTVTAAAKGIAIKAALALFAGVMAVIALGYALSALHAYLVTITGPIEATLIMAGAFALLAVLGVVAILVWPRPSKGAAVAAAARRDAKRTVEAAKDEVEAARRKVRESVATAEEPAELNDMKSGLGALASALGEAGFRREQAGLRAGLALAEQLRPMQLVSLALIGGFVAGVRLTRRR